jgi:hypothetical protein
VVECNKTTGSYFGEHLVVRQVSVVSVLCSSYSILLGFSRSYLNCAHDSAFSSG